MSDTDNPINVVALVAKLEIYKAQIVQLEKTISYKEKMIKQMAAHLKSVSSNVFRAASIGEKETKNFFTIYKSFIPDNIKDEFEAYMDKPGAFSSMIVSLQAYISALMVQGVDSEEVKDAVERAEGDG